MLTDRVTIKSFKKKTMDAPLKPSIDMNKYRGHWSAYISIQNCLLKSVYLRVVCVFSIYQ